MQWNTHFIQRFPELGSDSIDFGIDAPVMRYFRIHFLKKRTLRSRVRAVLKSSAHREAINELRLRILGLA